MRLRALLFPDPGPVDPETVYLRALLELYGDELEMPFPESPVTSVALAVFQREGYERAVASSRSHHGVIYADGVGTGKTEIGLAFIEEYALRLGQHALVVAPAQLVSNWRERIDQARLPAQVISYQQFASDEQLAPTRHSAIATFITRGTRIASWWWMRHKPFATPIQLGIAPWSGSWAESVKTSSF